MRKIVCTSMALLLFLTSCTAPMPSTGPTESFTQGIYEFSFSVEQISGEPTDEWEFIYTYQGETISSGHRILFSLELFTFHSVQVDVVKKGTLNNKYSATFPVAICNGGTGKVNVTVTESDEKMATFLIVCQVTQVGKQ